MGTFESNEMEVLGILKALQIFVAHFHARLVVESDWTNVIW